MRRNSGVQSDMVNFEDAAASPDMLKFISTLASEEQIDRSKALAILWIEEKFDL